MAKQENPLTGEALIKEVCRRIRVARSYWDAHNNAICRGIVTAVQLNYSEVSLKHTIPAHRGEIAKTARI